jgi:hypothetical protein
MLPTLPQARASKKIDIIETYVSQLKNEEKKKKKDDFMINY